MPTIEHCGINFKTSFPVAVWSGHAVHRFCVTSVVENTCPNAFVLVKIKSFPL